METKQKILWCRVCEDNLDPTVGEESTFLIKDRILYCPKCGYDEIFEDEPFSCTGCGVSSEEGRVCFKGDRCSNFQWGTCRGTLQPKPPRRITWPPARKSDEDTSVY